MKKIVKMTDDTKSLTMPDDVFEFISRLFYNLCAVHYCAGATSHLFQHRGFYFNAELHACALIITRLPRNQDKQWLMNKLAVPVLETLRNDGWKCFIHLVDVSVEGELISKEYFSTEEVHLFEDPCPDTDWFAIETGRLGFKVIRC